VKTPPSDKTPNAATGRALSLQTVFCLVVVLAFVCFIPDLKNGLLDWDDAGYILENSHISSLSFETIRWAFTEFYCNYWAPLTWLSLAVDYAVWGFNPFGYHLTNNVLHALNSGLFFLIAFQLLQRYHDEFPGSTLSGNSRLLVCSLLAALLFGIHPLRVESVVWAAERKDVLSIFFGLGALLAYLKYTKDAAPPAVPSCRYRWYWLMLALYLLSLLSKVMLITLPFVLIVLDWFPLRRLNRNTLWMRISEKLPLLLFAVPASLVTMKAMEVSSKSFAEIDLITRLLIAFKSILTYLRLSLLPLDISPVYFHPVTASFNFEYVVAIILVMAISAWCAVVAVRRPVIPATWLVFLITLFPVLGLTQNGPQEMAPRFTYFPAMALSLLAALGIVSLLARFSRSGVKATVIWLGVCAILAGFASLTVRDIGFWRDDVALWSRVIELQPHRFGRAYSQRAVILYRQGEYRKALEDVNEALSIAERKQYAAIHEIYAQRARIQKSMKEYEGAAADYNKAVELSGEPHRGKYSAELEDMRLMR
jgi:hypothetical protein